MNGIFGVCIRKTFLNVDIMKRTCTCRGWEMSGIPCEHAAAVILSIGQNVVDFVQDWYKFPMQELIYSGSFSGIETLDMPYVDIDGLVRFIVVKFSSLLTLPIQNAIPEDQGRSALSPNFKINGLSIALNLIHLGTIGKNARILCLKCLAVSFFHYWNFVPLYCHYLFRRYFLKVVTNQEQICKNYHRCVVMVNITSKLLS